ncbi:hypothetical protein [Salana multivorans]
MAQGGPWLIDTSAGSRRVIGLRDLLGVRVERDDFIDGYELELLAAGVSPF